MLTQTLWRELSPEWPVSYWDEYMRLPNVRLGRACIRPEISRTHTFGIKGISGGQFYNAHLKYNYLNPTPVRFDSKKLYSKFVRPVYDIEFRRIVYQKALPVLIENLTHVISKHEYRLEYGSQRDFMAKAKFFNLMTDFKYGVPRTAYMGIIPIFREGIRIYLAPNKQWNNYNLSWV